MTTKSDQVSEAKAPPRELCETKHGDADSSTMVDRQREAGQKKKTAKSAATPSEKAEQPNTTKKE